MADDTEPDLSYIIEPLRSLAVAVGDLNFDPENARKHGPENVRATRDSLVTNGQYLPLVVQKEGMIVRVGNNRLAIAKELGWTHVAAVVVPMSRVEAVRIALADNRTGELASWDYKQLTELIGEFEPDVFAGQWDERELAMFMEATFTPPEPGDLPSPSGSNEGGGAPEVTDDTRAINFGATEYSQLLEAATNSGFESLPEFVMHLLHGADSP